MLEVRNQTFLRKYDDRYEAYIVDLEAQGIHEYSKKDMDKSGIDISNQYSKRSDQYLKEKNLGE